MGVCGRVVRSLFEPKSETIWGVEHLKNSGAQPGGSYETRALTKVWQFNLIFTPNLFRWHQMGRATTFATRPMSAKQWLRSACAKSKLSLDEHWADMQSCRKCCALTGISEILLVGFISVKFLVTSLKCINYINKINGSLYTNMHIPDIPSSLWVEVQGNLAWLVLHRQTSDNT